MVPKSFYPEFEATIQGRIPVFHNANYDIEALRSLKPEGYNPFHFVDSSSVWGSGHLYHDTLIASHVYRNTGSHGLKDLAFEYLDLPPDDEDNLYQAIRTARAIARRLKWSIARREETTDDSDESGSWLKVDSWLPKTLWDRGEARQHPEYPMALAEYGDRDAERTIGLFLFLQAALKEQNLWDVYLEQLELVPVISGIHKRGISLNLKSLEKEYSRYTIEQSELLSVLQRVSGKPELNPGSPKQLVTFLMQELGVPSVKRTKAGQPSLDKHTLPLLLIALKAKPLSSPRKNEQAVEFLEVLSEYRKVSTSIGYLKQYRERQEYSRVYPRYNQTGTDTTRVSASRPGIQQVGKGEKWEDDSGVHSDYKLRKAFGPFPNRVWFCLDYKQLQLRIFATLAEERGLLDGFEAGLDAHDSVARKLFFIPEGKAPTDIQRRSAKAVNFGYIFGKSEKKLDLIQPGLGNTVKTIFPSATRYLKDMKSRLYAQKREEGVMTITTRGGYRLEVPPRINSQNDFGDQVDRPYAGVCYEVQGAEGILVKRAMVSTNDYLTSDKKVQRNFPFDTKPKPDGLPGAFLSFQVHDELVFDFVKPGGLKPKQLRDYYKEYVVYLRDLMVEAGTSLGFTTPVTISIVESTWDNPQELDW